MHAIHRLAERIEKTLLNTSISNNTRIEMVLDACRNVGSKPERAYQTPPTYFLRVDYGSIGKPDIHYCEAKEGWTIDDVVKEIVSGNITGRLLGVYHTNGRYWTDMSGIVSYLVRCERPLDELPSVALEWLEYQGIDIGDAA